jgi:hypothetical protein
MGYTITPVSKNITTEAFLKSQIETPSREVIKIGKGKKGFNNFVPYYLAVTEKGSERVYAVVAIVERKNGNLTYKFIGEDEGPFYYDCPDSVFSLLTTPRTENAGLWRFKVQWIGQDSVYASV